MSKKKKGRKMNDKLISQGFIFKKEESGPNGLNAWLCIGKAKAKKKKRPGFDLGELAKKIKEYGIKEMVIKTGIPQTTVYEYSSRPEKMPLKNFLKIADALKIKIDFEENNDT